MQTPSWRPPHFLLATGLCALASLCALGCKAGPSDAAAQGAESKVDVVASKEGSSKASTTDKSVGGTPTAASNALPAAVLKGDFFGVYNMLHNRPLSHRVEVVDAKKVFVLDALSEDVVRYINGNYPNDWRRNVKIGDERAMAINNSRKAALWFPGFEGATQAQALQMRVYNPAKGINTLKLKLNGKPLKSMGLKPGWHTIVVPVAAGVGLAENLLNIEFTDMGRFDGKLSGGALQWLRLGAASALSDATATTPTDTPGAQDALSLAANQGASWTMWALPKSKLSFGTKGQGSCHALVDVMVQDGTGGVKRASRVKLPAQGGAVDLSSISAGQGQVMRVDVMADATCTQPLVISNAQLVVPGKRPTRPAFEPPKYIVFWMIDTLRADHLSFYNDKTNVKTPALSKLASEGVTFRVANVQGNESKVSHASLFSGLFPNRHRVMAKGKLKPEHEIMPEAMKKAGYKTGAHISNGYISKPWGFQQGWNHFINNLRDGWRIDGKSMAKHGIDWMKKNKDSSFFLYIGTIDPHVTYRAHDGLIQKYDGASYNGKYKKYLSGGTLGKIKGGKLKVSARDKTRIKNLYKNEITFNDEAFASLRAAFEAEGIWDKTMVVVTADHGDEFWEHGGVGHGHNIHQELVHVPLVMYYPPAIKANTVVRAGVDVLDVYPTLVDIVGKKRPSNLQGKSILPLTYNAHGGYPEPATATKYLGHYAMQTDRWKLYLRKGDFSLYDRNADPLEMKHVEAANPLATRWLLDSISWFRANRKTWDKERFGVATNLSGTFLNERKKPAPKP